MTSLELIVRPFQTRDVTPPTKIVGKEKTVESPELMLGDEGGKAFEVNLSFGANVDVNDKDTYVELKRDTSTKRVENPDDNSQFVDVEVINKLWTRNKLDPNLKRNYELNNK